MKSKSILCLFPLFFHAPNEANSMFFVKSFCPVRPASRSWSQFESQAKGKLYLFACLLYQQISIALQEWKLTYHGFYDRTVSTKGSFHTQIIDLPLQEGFLFETDLLHCSSSKANSITHTYIHARNVLKMTRENIDEQTGILFNFFQPQIVDQQGPLPSCVLQSYQRLCKAKLVHTHTHTQASSSIILKYNTQGMTRGSV